METYIQICSSLNCPIKKKNQFLAEFYIFHSIYHLSSCSPVAEFYSILYFISKCLYVGDRWHMIIGFFVSVLLTAHMSPVCGIFHISLLRTNLYWKKTIFLHNRGFSQNKFTQIEQIILYNKIGKPTPKVTNIATKIF